MLKAKAENNCTLTPYLTTSSKLEKYALNIIRNLKYCTSDDFHVLEAEIENNNRDRRVIGALLKSLERQGYLTPVGYVKSGRKECHGRPVVRWRVNFAEVDCSEDEYQEQLNGYNHSRGL